MCAAGLDQYGVARVTQHRHQWQNIFLQQWLAARDLDERAFKTRDAINDILERSFLSFVKGVLGIAVTAAEIAECQPDEDTTLAGPGTLALDGFVNLVDSQRFFVHSTLV